MKDESNSDGDNLAKQTNKLNMISQELPNHGNKLSQAAMDSLNSHIVVLDKQGHIISVNQAWVDFACKCGLQHVEWVGINYLQVCDEAVGFCSEDAPHIAAGIRAVISGEKDWYALEYPCHDHQKQRWFTAQVSPLLIEGKRQGVVVSHRNITERKKMEEALRESEENLSTTLHSIGDGVIATNSHGCIIRMNPQAEKLTGWKAEKAIGKPIEEIFHIINARSGEQAINPVLQVLNEGLKIELANDTILVSRDGTRRMISDSAAPIYNSKTEITGAVMVFSDVTDEYQARQALRESEEKYRLIFEHSPLGIMHFNQKGIITACNEKFVQIIGSSHEALIGLNLFKLPDHKIVEKIKGTLQGHSGNYEGDYRSVTALKVTPVRVLFAPSTNTLGEVTGGIAMVEDITERKRYEEQLKYMSLHDQLTHLYNRTYFENELSRLEGSREHPITIINIDLDGLKIVNDTLGHEYGDDLLKSCAKLLKSSLRSSDILARGGGDEFAAILPRTDKKTGEEIVSRLQSRVEEYNRKLVQMPLSVSVGLATAATSQAFLWETFKEADDLMYRDKLYKGASAKSQIIKSLLAALGERDFVDKGHIQRLEEICVKIGKKVKLSKKRLANLALLAQVHDLGKVGIPDQVLFKKESLNEKEWEIMRQHSEKGYRIALSSQDLSVVANLILMHHEQWDGNGYPLGVKGKQIPVECRILAIVDAYDAITSERPYRKGISREEALEEIKRCSGTHFDPELVKVALPILEDG